ncbi:MAG: DUF7133 domain-containing protein, partial [Akkermansiaceae bacterium]
NYSNVVRPGGKLFADGSKSVSFRQCKLARFRPDGSEFENVTAGPNNIWGFLQKNNGETFLQEANDLGIPVTEYIRGTHYKTGSKEKLRSYAPQVPSSLQGFQMGGTGLSGIALTEDKQSAFNQLHKAAENVFYVVNPITNRIQIVTTVRDENGHHSYKKQADFLTSDDKWFRPVAAHFGPDGCLYIVDWYNKIISHNEVPRAHPDRDKTRGRIWRIRPNNLKPTAPTNFAKADTAGLIKGLKSSNERAARLAWHAIADRKNETISGIKEALRKMVTDTSLPANPRVLAFWSLEDLGALKSDIALLSQLAKDSSVYLRFEVVRSLSNMHLSEKDFLAVASSFPADKNYRVRAELANTIRSHRSPTPAIIALAAQLGRPPLKGLSRSSYDRNFERYLARWAMEKHGSITAKMLESDAAQSLKPEAFLLAIQSLDPANASTQLIKAIPRLKRDLSADELSLLGSQINKPQVKQGLRDLLASPTRQLSVLKAMEKIDAKLANDKDLSNIVGDACISLLKNQPSKENQALTVRLAAKFKLKVLEVPIKKWLTGKERTHSEIISGLTALSEMGSDSREVYQKFFTHAHAPIKRQATIALASSGNTAVVKFFADAWEKLPSDLRQLAVAGLTSSKPKAELLAKAAAAGHFKGLTADSLGNIIAALGNDHPSVKTILKNTPGLIVPVIKLTGKPTDQVKHPIELKGAFTIEAWIKLDPGIGAEDSILANGNGGADLNFYGGRFRFYGGRKHGDRIIAKRAMQPNLWTHCAVTRNGNGQFKIYLDGELDNAAGNPTKASFPNLTIGNSNHPGGSSFEMLELRVWNYERSAEEIRANHLTEINSNPPKGLTHRLSGGTSGLKYAGSAHTAFSSNTPKLITPAAAKAAQTKFQKFLKMAESKGDAAKGKALFASCSACHKVGESGGTIGPELSGAGAMSTEALLHNILTPNAKMESGYYRHDLILKNGNKISGSMVEETKTTISIQPVGGAIKVVDKKDIKNHNISKSSLMPEGLIDHMTPQQVADLFSYLRTLK